MNAPASAAFRRLGAALLAACLFAAPLASVHAEELEEFADEMDAHLDKVQQQTEADPLAPLPPMTESADPGTGMSAELSRLVREHFNALTEVRNGYLQTLARVGMETLLDPARLAADTDYADSRRILAEARAAAEAARRDGETILRNFPARIRASALSPSEKADMIRGVESATPRALASIAQTYALEFEAYDLMSGMIDLLAGTTWQLENGNIAFDSDADIEKFNGSLARIQQIVEEQTAMQSDRIDDARDSLDKLR